MGSDPRGEARVGTARGARAGWCVDAARVCSVVLCAPTAVCASSRKEGPVNPEGRETPLGEHVGADLITIGRRQDASRCGAVNVGERPCSTPCKRERLCVLGYTERARQGGRKVKVCPTFSQVAHIHHSHTLVAVFSIEGQQEHSKFNCVAPILCTIVVPSKNRRKTIGPACWARRVRTDLGEVGVEYRDLSSAWVRC